MSDEEEIEYASGDEIIVQQDKVAGRTIAYVALLEATKRLKNDPDLRKESLLMLARIRLSFSASSEAPVELHRGGKH